MAEPQHSALAKQGTQAIARWREERFWRRRRLDLSGASLSGARLVNVDLSRDDLSRIDLTNSDLRLADLSRANLQAAHLWRSNLANSNLTGANLAGAALGRTNLAGSSLQGADLRRADLTSADLTRANLASANLAGANLTGANLSWASLHRANLNGARMTSTTLTMADLTGVDLRGAQLVKADLDSAVLSEGVVEMTLFADCDLGRIIGLETVIHSGPSIIGLDTLARSGGLIPTEFLHRAGVARALIDVQDQLRLSGRTEPRVLLVGSYQDSGLARRFQADLRSLGFPCWSLEPDDESALLVNEDPLGRAMYYDRLVLICSGNSLENPHTSRFFNLLSGNGTARAGQTILPVATDDLFYSRQDELCQALRQRTTLDLRGWAQEEVYRQGVDNLVEALSRQAVPAGRDWDDPTDG